jgi:steroid 5-alpha reductase family enzyme
MSIQDTILPSLGLHASLSGIAYVVSRLTNRAEGKDYLWPSGLVINAWYHSVLRHTLRGVPFPVALRQLDSTQRLVLGGVTLWGGRLFYRIVKRSIERGHDDPRYDSIKTPSAWNLALFTKFLPEALVQTLISLSWALPLNDITDTSISAPREYAGVVHSAAVGLFAVGLGMEVLADWQLESNKSREKLVRTGVWSIVRHPKYVPLPFLQQDQDLELIRNVATSATPSSTSPSPSSSTPTLTSTHSPSSAQPSTTCKLFLLSDPKPADPSLPHRFLRYIGGDKENEASQESRYAKNDEEKYAQLKAWQGESNSFWPRLQDLLGNPWAAAVVGGGVATACMERFVRRV